MQIKAMWNVSTWSFFVMIIHKINIDDNDNRCY